MNFVSFICFDCDRPSQGGNQNRLRRQRQKDLCVFKESLVYLHSKLQDTGLHRETLSQKKKTQIDNKWLRRRRERTSKGGGGLLVDSTPALCGQAKRKVRNGKE